MVEVELLEGRESANSTSTGATDGRKARESGLEPVDKKPSEVEVSEL
jgi:hypothetical protein